MFVKTIEDRFDIEIHKEAKEGIWELFLTGDDARWWLAAQKEMLVTETRLFPGGLETIYYV